jgi:hypothetical protein
MAPLRFLQRQPRQGNRVLKLSDLSHQVILATAQYYCLAAPAYASIGQYLKPDHAAALEVWLRLGFTLYELPWRLVLDAPNGTTVMTSLPWSHRCRASGFGRAGDVPADPGDSTGECP